jgi:hypothetical protein
MRPVRSTPWWWALGIAACAVVVAGCGDDGPSSTTVVPTTTGPTYAVNGLAEATPTCPVERPGQVCPPAPVAGTVTARRGVTVVATASSDATGHFTLSLPAGSYEVTLDPGNVLPSCPPVTLVVADHAVDLTIECDTGIR